MTIKKTANVMPTSRAANFPLSFTKSLYAILRVPFTIGFILVPFEKMPAVLFYLQNNKKIYHTLISQSRTR
jgi:hypothetical protein